MISNQPVATTKLADQAAHSADVAIRATQRVANGALDNLAKSVEGLRQEAAPLLDRANEQAHALAQRGMDAVRDGTHQVRERALRASDATTAYIQHDPLKSVLIAAAAGAALMALIGLMTRSHGRG